MRHQKKNHHFFSYIVRHLAGIFALIAIAVMGSVAGRVMGETFLPITSSSTSTIASTEISPTLALEYASFSVSTTTIVSCATGNPLTTVSFLTTNALAGDFIVSSSSDMTDARSMLGEQLLPNGTYYWKANLRFNFSTHSPVSGVFDIQNACPVIPKTEAPKSVSVATTTNVLPHTNNIPPSPLPRPEVRLFIDNEPIGDSRKVLDNEEVEVRVVTTSSVMVEIIAINSLGATQIIGEAVKDDLLSRTEVDVWSYILDVEKLEEGTVRLSARVKYADGKVLEGERVSMNISHVRTLSSTPSPVRPVIKTGTPSSVEEKSRIIARTSDPASCGNASECDIYCKSVASASVACESFAQEIIAPSPRSRTSLADNISDARLMLMLTERKKRSKEIPEMIQSPSQFRQFCGATAHLDVCIKMLTRNDLSAPDALREKKEVLQNEKMEDHEMFSSRVGARAFLDTDDDGVLDFDEVNIYQTDPSNGDTDSDGFQDGAEVLARTNPRGGMLVEKNNGNNVATGTIIGTQENPPGESIVFENPLIAGELNATMLAVKSIEIVAIAQDNNGTTTLKKLKFEGIGPPNSFVTLYIFSDPIVVTVKVDTMGSWTYTFDKELPDGTHQVYTTITNTEGQILAKSNPLSFVKTASAVSLGSSTLLPQEPQIGFFSGTSLYALFAIIIGILGIALSVLGFVIRHERKEENSIIPQQ